MHVSSGLALDLWLRSTSDTECDLLYYTTIGSITTGHMYGPALPSATNSSPNTPPWHARSGVDFDIVSVKTAIDTSSGVLALPSPLPLFPFSVLPTTITCARLAVSLAIHVASL
jgi:hypothetical protein